MAFLGRAFVEVDFVVEPFFLSNFPDFQKYIPFSNTVPEFALIITARWHLQPLLLLVLSQMSSAIPSVIMKIKHIN